MLLKVEVMILIACIASCHGGDVWTGLTAKWSLNASDAFYTIPPTLDDATLDGWTEISDIEDSEDVTALGYYGDPTIALLFSKQTGKIIGYHVAFLVSSIEDAEVPINYADNRGITTKTINGEKYFTAATYFSRSDDGETRRIWIQEQDGRLVEYPTNPEELSAQGMYYLNKCVDWMGAHYYPISSNLTDCASIYPWLFVSVENEIVGVGFLAVGPPSSTPKRTWFETLPSTYETIKDTIPAAPECLPESAAKYGYMVFHFYFLDNVLDVYCDDTFSAKYVNQIDCDE